MTAEMIMINGRPLRYRVRRHARARRRLVRVTKDNGVVVTLPKGDHRRVAKELLAEWSDWVEEKVDDLGVWDGPQIPSYATGSEIYFLGRPRVLDIGPLPFGQRRSRMWLSNDTLHLELLPGEVLDPRDALIRHLKKEAGIILRSRVDHWAEITELYPAKVMVGERKTRWGSCSSRRTISLCYRLVMAPSRVIDAIVVHELCHLEHMDHSSRFWELVHSTLPDYEKWDGWLRQNSHHLKP